MSKQAIELLKNWEHLCIWQSPLGKDISKVIALLESEQSKLVKITSVKEILGDDYNKFATIPSIKNLFHKLQSGLDRLQTENERLTEETDNIETHLEMIIGKDELAKLGADNIGIDHKRDLHQRVMRVFTAYTELQAEKT